MNRRWQRFLALVLTVFLVVVNFQPAFAGFGFGGVVDSVVNGGKNKAQNAVYQQIGKQLGLSDPIRLDQKTAYKKVEVRDFQPKKLEIHSIRDLLKPLPVGDYVMDIIAYCTQWSIHSPGKGMAYKLAPLEGKAAPIVSALLFRGALKGIPPAQLQAISWRIQGGIPISQWSEAEQKLADKLIPEYKGQLKGDLLQDYQNQYAGFRGKVPIQLPSFDEALGKLGSVGKTIVEVKRVHQTLTDRTIAAERLPDMLYEHTDNQPRVLPALAEPEKLQWNEIRKGVYASFAVDQGNLGNNTLNFRITPEALSTRIPANGVKVASVGTLVGALPVEISPLDVVFKAANDNSWLRLVANNTSKGAITLEEAAIALPEAELLAIIFGLPAAAYIGYNIGRYGAQALIAALRTPKAEEKPNCNGSGTSGNSNNPPKFGDQDLVYGPSAGGNLRRLQQQAGGRLLNDLDKPTNLSWKQFSIQTMEKQLALGGYIRFDLTNITDIEGILQKTGTYSDTVTATELRYLRENWTRFRNNVTFYNNGKGACTPWIVK